MSNLVSLANSEKSPAGVGVAVNRKMIVWDHFDCRRDREYFVPAWDGSRFCTHNTRFTHACEIPAKKMRPYTHAEIFKELAGKALFMDQSNYVSSYWTSHRFISWFRYILISDYTGTDADVWRELTKEVDE